MATSLTIIQNFINNEYFPAKNFIASYDPAIGEVWAKVPDSDAEEVEQAYQAAKKAFSGWKKTTVEERSRLLLKIADILESRLEEFAIAESRDNGKPISVAKNGDIPRAVLNFRFFATSILHYQNRSTYQEAYSALNYTTRHPIGVVGIIAPWNLPMYLLSWKIAPCIATGNTCVCKPSELTSVTAYMLCDVLLQAGLPAGVVNMVFGYGSKVGEAIVSHPGIPLITFTGSTATGKIIQRSSAEHCKKLSLELGGKNSGIVFSDADLEKCIPTIVRSCFANQGEICLCTERLFVHEEVFEEFLEKFVEATRKLKVGDPTSPASTTGSLVSKDHLDKVKSYINMAVKQNGKIRCGHLVDDLDLSPRNKNGYFILPTVLTGLKDDSCVNQEEIFGPVVTVTTFTTEQEVIERSNNISYGLSATVFSRDVGKVHRVAQALDVGTVWCNCWVIRDLRMPFGGTKKSGLGRESQDDSLDFFTEQKTVCVKIDV